MLRWQHTGIHVALDSTSPSSRTRKPVPMTFTMWLSAQQLRLATDTIQLISASELAELRYAESFWCTGLALNPRTISSIDIHGWDQSNYFQNRKTYTLWWHKMPPGMFFLEWMQEKPLCFSFFSSFLYLSLSWGVVGESGKLLRCCNNIYTTILSITV